MANDKWSGSNPWLGLTSYTEGTPLYGRTKESAILSEIIKDNIATIVYGKSGIGKSSLLSAGISPMLRGELFIPVPLRLVHNTDIGYVEQIENRVRELVECTDELPADVSDLGLWDFFHRHTFKKDGVSCTPVIILDQFEEIYTLTDAEHKSGVNALFTELASLFNDIKPDSVLSAESSFNGKTTVGASADDDFSFELSSESAFAYKEDIAFRFVVCLREDKLYLLERNSANIPSLKTNRYNLQALSSDSALEVITCPRPGLFPIEEASSIIDKLADMGDEGIRTVDPAILSLFLFKYYEKKGEANYDNIFADYYQEATKGIGRNSIAFLENHLLTLGGYRNQIPLSDALSSGVLQSEIDTLLRSVILRTEKRKGIDYIEFSHDRLCAEAMKNREERTMREQAMKARKRMLWSLLIFAISAGMLSFVLWQMHQLAIEKKATQIEKSGRLSAEAATDSINSLNLANEKQLQLIDSLNKNLTSEKEALRLSLEDRERQIAIINKQQREIEALRSGADIDSMCISNKAGQLSENIPMFALEKITKLKISGELNSSDFYHLRTALKSNLKYLDLKDAKIVAGGIPYYEGNFQVKDCVTKDNVIGAYMFYNSKSLETIMLPDGVVSIGFGAFFDCKNLTSINIPDGVTSIGMSAFNGCTSLTSINIPDCVTSIERAAFHNCSSLTSIAVDARNPKYDSRNNCNAIIETSTNKLLRGCMNTVIPKDVTSIEFNAFYGCTNLTSISIPAGVTSIGVRAFCECSGLTSIVVDAGNPQYDSRNNCNAIIETSTNKLLCGCMNTVIPKDVTSIEYSAFSGCKNLTSINIPDGVTSIGDDAFTCCTSLASINIPAGVTSIEQTTFRGCTSLTSIDIPDGVTSIGYCAFGGCENLTTINIPDGVTSIGIAAFSSCTSLNQIYSKIKDINKCDITEGAFEGVSSTCTWHVPSGTSENYRSQPWWVSTWEIVEEAESAND